MYKTSICDILDKSDYECEFRNDCKYCANGSGVCSVCEFLGINKNSEKLDLHHIFPELSRFVFKAMKTASIRMNSYKYFDAQKRKEIKLKKDQLNHYYIVGCLMKPCHYCGHNSIGLDRIDNKKGHSISNTVPCCRECNVIRMDKFTHEEFEIVGIGIKLVKDNRGEKYTNQSIIDQCRTLELLNTGALKVEDFVCPIYTNIIDNEAHFIDAKEFPSKDIKFASSRLIDDIEFFKRLVDKWGDVLYSFPMKYRNSVELAKYCSNINVLCYNYFSEEVRANMEVCERYILKRECLLKNAPQEIKSNFEFACKVVAQYDGAYRYISDELKECEAFHLDLLEKNPAVSNQIYIHNFKMTHLIPD